MADIFEELVYSPDDVITFQNGIPGFEAHKKFVLVKIPAYEPFEWLVNVETKKLRFALINPLLFRSNYNPNIHKSQITDLGLENKEDVLLYCIVTISPDPALTTANLLGPVLINRAKRLGKQIILDDEAYSVKEKIIP